MIMIHIITVGISGILDIAIRIIGLTIMRLRIILISAIAVFAVIKFVTTTWEAFTIQIIGICGIVSKSSGGGR